MAPKVEFLFDFGSPNAYFADKVVPEIEARTGVRFDYVPVLLGGIFKLTGNKPPMEALQGIRNKREQMEREMQRFIRKHNITEYRFNPNFPVNTLMLMRGAVAAQKEGMLLPYVKAGLHHMWEAQRKMDDPQVFRAALLESGLDADRIIARSQDADVKNTLIENTQNAVDRGVFGIPSFFVGDELFFGKDQLRDVEDEIVAQQAS